MSFGAEYARKVLSQFWNYFLHPYKAAARLKSGEAFLRYERVLDLFKRTEDSVASAAWIPTDIANRWKRDLDAARPQIDGHWPSAFRLGFSIRNSVLFAWLRRLFIPDLAASAFIVACAALTPKWRNAIDWRLLAPVACVSAFALGTSMLSALSSSLAQALEIQRYIDLFMPMTLAAQLLAPLLALSLLNSKLRGVGR